MLNKDTPPNHRVETISGKWELDPQRSSVEFRTKLLWGLLSVKGHFDDYRGRLDMSANPAIELTIDAASVQSRNRRRDQHLRSGDFFDTETHPLIEFRSESVELRDRLKVSGRLTAAGHSIPVTLDAHVRIAEGELQIEASTSAPHRELGMTYSPLGTISAHSELIVKARLIPRDASG